MTNRSTQTTVGGGKGKVAEGVLNRSVFKVLGVAQNMRGTVIVIRWSAINW